MNNLTVASFFSGIGGFGLGFQNTGSSIQFQCEIDEFCNSILERHWPKVPRATDIKEINDGKEVPEAVLWCAGFPCQDVSLARARQRAGLDGRHTGLFYDFARLLDDARPPESFSKTSQVFSLPMVAEISESFRYIGRTRVWRRLASA